MILLRQFIWETRLLLRGSQAWWIGFALLAAGLLAAWSGVRRLDEHKAEIERLPGYYEAQMKRIAPEFTPTGEAGYVSYYTFYPTYHPLSPLGGLSFGVRDVAPDVLWVRLLGIEGQLYESDLGNPALQSLGGFDLAFVWMVLAPLALLVLSHDVLTREREDGRLALLAVQGNRLISTVFIRILVRFIWVGFFCSAAFVVAADLLEVPRSAWSFGWLGTAWAHLLFWAGFAAVVAVWSQTVAGSLATALVGWVTLVILLPALLNLVLVRVYPVRDGIELTVKQRQESHSAWDKPRAETMGKFFAHNPDWSGTPPVTGRFAWRWYYAMQQVGDESVAAESLRYRENLRARQTAILNLAWFAPATYAQLALSARAGTDLDSHLDYLDRVRAFHGELRKHFYPLFFAEASITPADYATFPKYQPGQAVPPANVPGPWPLLTVALAGFACAFVRLRKAPAKINDA